MKKKSGALLCLFYLLVLPLAFAQLNITYPSDRAILQRDNNNQATVHIAGYFTTCVDRIEARFVPIKSNPSGDVMGTPAPKGGDWQIITNTATCNNFSSSMTVTGGWYRLEVRGIKSGQANIESSVQHVGIGEVFLVSGQSNVTGGDGNLSGPGASEDAVSSVNFRTAYDVYSKLTVKCPEYVHLDKTTTTAPFGNYAWCWGLFGDRMVKKLNVPVMIFNAGWSATGIENWKQSIPSDAVSYAWYGIPYPAGLPFGIMRIALNHYIAQSGIRAVLWHQGETDTKVQTSRQLYRDDLTRIISECRNLSGKPNMAWVVSRASRYTFTAPGEQADASHTSEAIISAQNDVIGIAGAGYDAAYKVSNVFEGPATDNYWNSDYRIDQVHFAGDGLDSLAKFWVNKLNDDFFKNSQPSAAINPADVTINHLTGSNTMFTASSGWNSYAWMNQNDCNIIKSTDQQWATGAGLFRLKTTDTYGNVVLTPSFYVPSASALPVTLKYFKGTANNQMQVLLQWATTEEVNASHFEIQRSNDAEIFFPVSKIHAFGNTSQTREYKFRDNLLTPGIYYYRLKQADKDGRYELSNIISLHISGEASVKLFPNPVSENLNIQSDKPIYSVEAFNSVGTQIMSSKECATNLVFDMTKYASGIYTFIVNGESFKILR